MQNPQNMYLVHTSVQDKFPWRDLHPDIQERILQHVPHDKRWHFTNPEGFPWRDLNPDIQEQILQLVPQHTRRYFTNPEGGFNWPELEPEIRAQIRNHLRDITQRRVVMLGLHWESWPVPYNMPGAVIHMRHRFSFERSRENDSRFNVLLGLNTASLLTVTFSTHVIRDAFLEEQAEQALAGRPELSAYELDSLCEQMERTTRWRNVHTIRLIRWPCPYSNNNNYDRYSFEFVSTDEHGNEVTSTLDTIDITTFKKDLLEDRFRQTYNSGIGLRLRRVTLATARRRRPIQDWRNDEDDEISRTDAVEWSI